MGKEKAQTWLKWYVTLHLCALLNQNSDENAPIRCLLRLAPFSLRQTARPPYR